MFTNFSAFPNIETERLMLRVPNEDDFDELARMYADGEVMTFLGGVVGREAVWRTLATFIGHWCLRGYGLFSVIDKSSGEFLGRVGLVNPDGWPALEIGWAIKQEAWGKGYATESSRAVLNHEVARLRPTRLISLVDPKNFASIKVASKLGAVACGETEFMGEPITIYAYPLPDAELAQTHSA